MKKIIVFFGTLLSTLVLMSSTLTAQTMVKCLNPITQVGSVLNINTGVDASTLLPITVFGVAEPRWRITAAPAASGLTLPFTPITVNRGNYATVTSQCISHTGNNTAGGSYTYDLPFCTDACLDSFRVAFRMMADNNACASIIDLDNFNIPVGSPHILNVNFFNAVANAPYDCTSTVYDSNTFGAWNGLKVDEKCVLPAGRHILRVVLRNTASTQTVLNVTGNIACISSSTPAVPIIAGITNPCVGQPYTLTVSNPQVGVNYTWTSCDGTVYNNPTGASIVVGGVTVGAYGVSVSATIPLSTPLTPCNMSICATKTNVNNNGVITECRACTNFTFTPRQCCPILQTSFTGKREVCAKEQTKICVATSGGTAPYTYTWGAGATPISGTSCATFVGSSSCPTGCSTTYTVLVTDAIGCTSTKSFNIITLPTPVITVTASPAIITAGGSSTLTAASGYIGYFWTPISVSGNPITVSPITTTTYTVTAYSCNGGCPAVGTVLVTVQSPCPKCPPTGLKQVTSPQNDTPIITADISSKTELLIVPNPASSKIQIQLAKWADNTTATLTIADLLGRTISTETIITNNEEVELAEYPNGIYIATLQLSNGTVLSQKIVKQ